MKQYFKSIEQVAASQGFDQFLPSEKLTLKKRDSVLEKLDSPKIAASKKFLAGSKAQPIHTGKQDVSPPALGLEPPATKEALPQAVPSGVDVPQS